MLKESFTYDTPIIGTTNPNRRLIDQMTSKSISEIDFYDCPLPDMKLSLIHI